MIRHPPSTNKKHPRGVMPTSTSWRITRAFALSRSQKTWNLGGKEKGGRGKGGCGEGRAEGQRGKRAAERAEEREKG